MVESAPVMEKARAWLGNVNAYAAIATGYLIFVTFPAWHSPISTGLDNSWIYGINHLPNSSYLFGRDVCFTFGPLGYLLVPQNLGDNIASSVMFWTAIHGFFALCLFYFLYRAKRKLQVILFALSYLLVYVLFRSLWSWSLRDYSLLLVAGLLLEISLDGNKILKYLSICICAVLASLLLFIKLNLGLGAFAMLVTYVAIMIARRGRQSWPVLLAGGIAYGVTTAIVALVTMKSPAAIVKWLRYSMDVAAGYGEAMSVVGSPVVLLAGVLCLVIYSGLVMILWKQKAQPVHVALIFMGPLFLAFKHGFCRQDLHHEGGFFAFFLAILCLLVLSAASRKELTTWVAGLLVVTICTAALFTVFIGINPGYRSHVSKLVANTGDFLRGKQGWSNVHSVLHIDDLRQRLDEQSRINLAADVLPPELVDRIKREDGTVDVLPWEICYCPANNLEWNPNPVLQIYSAYTASLDEWSARHYEADRPPEFLIVEFADIDGRHPLLGAPATWRSVILNYELSLWDSQGGRLLLRKNTEQGRDGTAVVNKENRGVNQWIGVPRHETLLFVCIDMRLSLLGRAAKTLFRIPPVCIDLVYESGRAMSYRIIPDTAKNGLLINYVPSSAEELSQLFAGVANDRVTRFRVSGPGTVYYADRIGLTWKEVPWRGKFGG